MKLTCEISQPAVAYDIEIRSGVLSERACFENCGSRFVIISDSIVGPLHALQLQAMLVDHGWQAWLFTFPSGERHKTRETKAFLEDQMFKQGLGRDTCVIALGGGVVTDMGGYIAATYCRGVPLIMAPTSLLAMVDASIGGKVGVDVPYGKNLVGSIYQPRKVLIDPIVLKTLSINELRNGFVEMIKHGCITDYQHFEFLAQHAEELLAGDEELLAKAIFDSCAIKKTIVEQDEKEQGMRRLLNFGHTVGHALELLSEYSLAHGEAVALGLLVEAHMAVQLGYLDETSFRRIHDVLRQYQLPLKLPTGMTSLATSDAMILDKKSTKSLPRFVMIGGIGESLPFKGSYCTTVDQQVVNASLEWMFRSFFND